VGYPDPEDGAANLLQKPVTIYTSIRRHISQVLNQHRHENFRITDINSSCVLPGTVNKKQDQRNKKNNVSKEM
jgi:predicted component of type VI protein secretion system